MKDGSTILKEKALPLAWDASRWDFLVEAIGDSQIVLLGEASHGSREFYRERALLTSRLIREKGFGAVAVEADWPDTHRAHRYAQGMNDDPHANAALDGFKRFPTWMWRNRVMVDSLEKLRTFNLGQPEARERIGVFGIDLYSLHASIDAVLDFLEKADPDAAERARERYSCFDHFGGDPQRYGYQTAVGQAEDCEEEVISQLVELRRHARELIDRQALQETEDFFSAEQNARLIANAEQYYRSMFQGRHATWNLRDTHMADTVDALIAHRNAQGRSPKLVVWAHNSHLGDCRATEMSTRGEINLGQLMRERHPEDVVSVGFSTYEGSVTAASDWGRPAGRMQVRPALPDSYEALFHRSGLPAFLLDLRSPDINLRSLLGPSRLQRAIGVIYRPETERLSHYFRANLLEQFDFLIHLDHTEAVEPLERGAYWVPNELPETYPFSA